MAHVEHVVTDRRRDEAGFTLIELLISMLVLMVVSGMVMQGTMDMVRLSDTMSNRANMHAGVRNATALLQQEVGQAGRISLPAPAALTATVVAGATTATVDSVAGMFVGQHLIIGTGSVEETVTITAIAGTQITTEFPFDNAHDAGSRVDTLGGFGQGVIPTTMANGSSGTVLKIFGDINGDGNMLYVEYTCNLNEGRMYRNVMAWNAAVKPAVTVEQILVNNLLANPADPDGTVRPCFTYEEETFGGNTYVIGVAIMTTVQTQERDPITKQFQSMTKALLNVAPRNVFNVWQAASLGNGYNNRVQPLPQEVVNLLP